MAIPDVHEPRPRFLATAEFEEASAISTWTPISSKLALSRTVEVLAAVGQSIFVIDGKEVSEIELNAGVMVEMAVSPNGKLVALFSAEGTLMVYSFDFQQKLLEFPTKSRVKPTRIAWCGHDSVMVLWNDILLMMGPFGDWIKYSYEQTPYLFTESDGVRIVSQNKYEFLQRVPGNLKIPCEVRL